MREQHDFDPVRGALSGLLERATDRVDAPSQLQRLHRTRHYRRRASIAVASFAVVVLSVAVPVLMVGKGEPVPDVGALLPIDAEWSLEATLDGWLDPIEFDGGYAALLEPEAGAGGDVWLSSDGVHWEPAPVQPPTTPLHLSSDGESLFAETRNVLAGAGDGIWASTTGGDWRPVLAAEDYRRLFDHVAAGGAGAVVFGVDHDGRIAGWVYDGDQFVLAEVGTIAALPPDEVNGLHVAALDDRFIFYHHDIELNTLVSFSTSGHTWSDVAPPAAESPLALLDNHLIAIASTDGLNLITMASSYGVWTTDDGSTWDRVSFETTNDLIPAIAAGELGWILYEGGWNVDDLDWSIATPVNRVFFSPDLHSWTELQLDDFGPLSLQLREGEQVTVGGTEVLVDERAKVAEVAFLVREFDVLVLTYLVDENYPWGGPFDPVTLIWRLPSNALPNTRQR